MEYMETPKPTVLFLGGYMEQGDRNNLRLSFPRDTRLAAILDAAHSAKPKAWQVVVKCVVLDVEQLSD